MLPSPHSPHPGLHPAGWLALLAFAVGLVTRLLKADKLNQILQRFGAPPIPKSYLPRIALVLGFLGGATEALTAGLSWLDALLAGLWGVFAGGGAIAGQETVAPVVRAAFGDGLANLLFGKKAPQKERAADAIVIADGDDEAEAPTPVSMRPEAPKP